MIPKVLDASALLEYLSGGSGCEMVQRVIESAAVHGNHLLMSAVNWGEVYYILIRKLGKESADQIIALVATLPIDVVSADQTTAQQAAVYKAVNKLPYADSFAAALAKIHRAELLTSDKEFEAVEKEVQILWV